MKGKKKERESERERVCVSERERLMRGPETESVKADFSISYFNICSVLNLHSDRRQKRERERVLENFAL